jgi:hypothetical protein
MSEVAVQPEFLVMLQESGFFEDFLGGLMEYENTDVLVSGFKTIEGFAKLGPVSEFRQIRKCLKTALKGVEEVAVAALFALKELTQHPKMVTALAGHGFEKYLARFEIGNERKAARKILNNLNATK